MKKKRMNRTGGHKVVTTEAAVAKGKCRRFDALDVLREELGIECLVGLPAEIRAAEPRKQKHHRRDQGKCPEGQCGLLHFRFVMNARLIVGIPTLRFASFGRQ